MSRRNRIEKPDNVFGELENKNQFDGINFEDNEPQTSSDIANAGYGAPQGHNDFSKMRTREKINYRNIEDVYPNPTQPRRVIPSSLRQYWRGTDADSMAQFFDAWLREVNLERGQRSANGHFPLDDILFGDETRRTATIHQIGSEDETLDQIGAGDEISSPRERALLRVVELAASIRRDGLTNPISVNSLPNGYEIETGERRWLAYQLLNWRMGHETDDFQKIPVREVDGVSIWRQASENNVRADLNAIGMARQFALLLMDLLADEKGEDFTRFNEYDHEQDFYAQVSDGNSYRIPRNRGEDLLNAMGLSDAGQLRHVRRLLRLPTVVWQLADDLNWAESFIQRTILTPANNAEDEIRSAIVQAKREGYYIPLMDDYDDLLEQSKPATSGKSQKRYTRKEFEKSLAPKVFNFIEKMDRKHKQETLDWLRAKLEELDS